MTETVVTETRTEVTTEEVTETRYRCHVCEMLYDSETVIKLGLDRQDGGGMLRDGTEPRAERTICHHCAEGLFEYEADSGGTFDESSTPYDADWVTTSAAFATVLLFITVPVAAISAGVALLGGSAALVVAAGAATVVGFVAGVLVA